MTTFTISVLGLTIQINGSKASVKNYPVSTSNPKTPNSDDDTSLDELSSYASEPSDLENNEVVLTDPSFEELSSALNGLESLELKKIQTIIQQESLTQNLEQFANREGDLQSLISSTQDLEKSFVALKPNFVEIRKLASSQTLESFATNNDLLEFNKFLDSILFRAESIDDSRQKSTTVDPKLAQDCLASFRKIKENKNKISLIRAAILLKNLKEIVNQKPENEESLGGDTNSDDQNSSLVDARQFVASLSSSDSDKSARKPVSSTSGEHRPNPTDQAFIWDEIPSGFAEDLTEQAQLKVKLLFHALDLTIYIRETQDGKLISEVFSTIDYETSDEYQTKIDPSFEDVADIFDRLDPEELSAIRDNILDRQEGREQNQGFITTQIKKLENLVKTFTSNRNSKYQDYRENAKQLLALKAQITPKPNQKSLRSLEKSCQERGSRIRISAIKNREPLTNQIAKILDLSEPGTVNTEILELSVYLKTIWEHNPQTTVNKTKHQTSEKTLESVLKDFRDLVTARRQIGLLKEDSFVAGLNNVIKRKSSETESSFSWVDKEGFVRSYTPVLAQDFPSSTNNSFAQYSSDLPSIPSLGLLSPTSPIKTRGESSGKIVQFDPHKRVIATRKPAPASETQHKRVIAVRKESAPKTGETTYKQNRTLPRNDVPQATFIEWLQRGRASALVFINQIAPLGFFVESQQKNPIVLLLKNVNRFLINDIEDFITALVLKGANLEDAKNYFKQPQPPQSQQTLSEELIKKLRAIRDLTEGKVQLLVPTEQEIDELLKAWENYNKPEETRVLNVRSRVSSMFTDSRTSTNNPNPDSTLRFEDLAASDQTNNNSSSSNKRGLGVASDNPGNGDFAFSITRPFSLDGSREVPLIPLTPTTPITPAVGNVVDVVSPLSFKDLANSGDIQRRSETVIPETPPQSLLGKNQSLRSLSINPNYQNPGSKNTSGSKLRLGDLVSSKNSEGSKAKQNQTKDESKKPIANKSRINSGGNKLLEVLGGKNSKVVMLQAIKTSSRFFGKGSNNPILAIIKNKDLGDELKLELVAHLVKKGADFIDAQKSQDFSELPQTAAEKENFVKEVNSKVKALKEDEVAKKADKKVENPVVKRSIEKPKAKPVVSIEAKAPKPITKELAEPKVRKIASRQRTFPQGNIGQPKDPKGAVDSKKTTVQNSLGLRRKEITSGIAQHPKTPTSLRVAQREERTKKMGEKEAGSAKPSTTPKASKIPTRVAILSTKAKTRT